MKFKRFSFIFVFMLILSTISAPLAFAKGPVPAAHKAKLKIAALGDSITFGYPSPSTTAFPDLITGAKEVVKFGGSGATTSQLLEAINSDPKAFKLAIKKADVITINIGSNDLMGATGVASLFATLQPLVPILQQNPADVRVAEAIRSITLTPLTSEQLLSYTANLTKIIATVQANTDAPIILYNMYDPIVLGNPALDSLLEPLHTFIEGNLAAVNAIINHVGIGTGSYVADAYSTFQANPSVYILPFDIHPTLEGHKALAALADAKLRYACHHPHFVGD